MATEAQIAIARECEGVANKDLTREQYEARIAVAVDRLRAFFERNEGRIAEILRDANELMREAEKLTD